MEFNVRNVNSIVAVAMKRILARGHREPSHPGGSLLACAYRGCLRLDESDLRFHRYEFKRGAFIPRDRDAVRRAADCPARQRDGHEYTGTIDVDGHGDRLRRLDPDRPETPRTPARRRNFDLTQVRVQAFRPLLGIRSRHPYTPCRQPGIQDGIDALPAAWYCVALPTTGMTD